MQSFMPLNVKSIQKLTEDEIEHIDQYLYRFAKLQDVIGEKLFLSFLSFLGENTEKKSFIDIFSRLGQLGVIRGYDKWIQLLLIKNELSHEYEDEPAANAEKLNRIFSLKYELESYYNNVRKYAKQLKGFN